MIIQGSDFIQDGEEIREYSKIITLERELKQRDSHIEKLLNEQEVLEEINRQQSEGLEQLTTDLYDIKQSHLTLQFESHKKLDESKKSLSTAKQQYDKNINHSQLIKKVTARDEREEISKEMYYHVMRLENELTDKKRIITALEEENKILGKLVKTNEAEFLKSQQEEQRDHLKDHSSDRRIVLLENRIRELENIMSDLEAENRLLHNIQQVILLSSLHSTKSGQNRDHRASYSRFELTRRHRRTRRSTQDDDKFERQGIERTLRREQISDPCNQTERS